MQARAILCAALALGAACGGEGDDELIDGVFTAAEWDKIATLSPLPAVPADPTNAYADDPAAAALGQALYFEPSFSGAIEVADDGDNGGFGEVGETGKISCEGCHMGEWFDDPRSQPNNVSLGVAWGTRNSTPIVNVAYYRWFYWEGRADTLWMQAAGAIENGTQQKDTRLHLVHVLYEKYREEYDAIFDPDLDAALDPEAADAARFPPAGKPKAAGGEDGPWEGMDPADQTITNRILVNFGKSVAAYERLVVSHDAPFDRYVAGETDAIGPAAKRGLKLFVGKAACVACHDTPLFSDNSFHNIGVPQEGEHVPETDTGRFDAVPKLLASAFNSAGAYSDDPDTGKLQGLAQQEDDRGKFRTKFLRQVGETGPYMHTGGVATLTDVVELYNEGGADTGFDGDKDARIVPLNLSTAEVADLVAFLETLTGEPVPAALMEDTAKP